MAIPQNEQLFQRALRCIPGGVNSPVRAFKAVGGTPAFITRAEGAYMWDARGRRLIDYIGSWGPMILGHGHPEVLNAVIAAAREGLSFGAPTEREIELAEHILRLMPSMQMVRLVNSGTEAGMSAIRLARGFTGRSKIVKFEGCYHGHADALLVKAGSGLATFGQATSAGVPPEVVQDTLVLEYNNIAQLEEAFDRFGNEIACVIMEPIAGNMNFVRASTAFMAAARRLTLHSGALLIIDEVMTGFRVALGGAQSLYAQQIEDFAPDLTVMGKVIGGGMPLAAFGGPRSIMEQLAPVGGVYQAGTLSGNPVATACGLATLKLIEQSGFYERLAQRTQELVQGLKAEADAAGVPFSVDCEGGMFGFFFLPELPQNYAQVMQSESARFNQFFHGMLSRGVYFAPALYEAGFVSAAHSAQDVQESLAAAREVFAEMVGVKARKRGADEPALPGVETPAVVPDVIHFYRVADEWGEFSNFAPWPVRIDGKTWPTTEHYFQAQKFADQAQQKEIRRANTPMEAARMGRDRTRKLRRDWESAKDDVMRVALRAKFTQHEALRALLLATGDARIVEHTVNDSYWGDGRSGRGRNMLGLLLMELREALRSQ